MNERKPLRLKGYNYAAGWYFVTACTREKQPLFWLPVTHNPISSEGVVGADIIRPLCPPALSELGSMVERAIREIPAHYPNVRLDKYVVMPNHIHLILALAQRSGRMVSAPTKPLSTVIGSMKRYTSRAAGFSLWQRSFYDHIIRNEADYLRIWNYIDVNPARWREDEYYIKIAQES